MSTTVMADSRGRVPVGPDRYTNTAIVFHWVIALLILGNLGLGYFMNGFSPAVRGVVISIHISSGMTVLILTVGRVLWRITHEPPPYPADMAPWERHLAHLNHLLLYAAMVIMPVTGWALISAHPPAGSPGAALAAKNAPKPKPPVVAQALPPTGRPAAAVERPTTAPRRTIWGVIPIPLISPVMEVGRTEGGVAPQKQIHDELVTAHGLEGYLVIFLLILHVVGALKHQYIDKRRELARIGIGRPDPLPAE